MLEYLRIGKPKSKMAPSPVELVVSSLSESSDSPISLRSLNELHDNIKQRIYRALIPHDLLSRFDINPITLKGPDKSVYVDVKTSGGSVELTARSPFDPQDPFFILNLEDNVFNSIDLNWLVISDPTSDRFDIDVRDDGGATRLGTTQRNLEAEEKAMLSGLAPAQIRSGLRGSAGVFHQIETFLITLGHGSVSLEPLTYVSAWVFEKRGFAYMRGHQLMRSINTEFQPGGALHKALDASTPFRQPEQWRTVRGRAWAIHDGILEAIDEKWDGLRMTKQVGRHAGVSTVSDVTF